MKPVSFEFNEINAGLVESLANSISNQLKIVEFNSFMVGVSFPKSLSEEEKEELKKSFQFPLVQLIEKLTKKTPNYENFELEIQIDFNSLKIHLTPQPVFIQGRYNKFSRELSQTFHHCFKCKGRGCSECGFTGKQTDESVEELISFFTIQEFKAIKAKFHGAGREDKDVLMLGKGRPFVLELIEPEKRSIDFKQLENKINVEQKNKIKVNNLQLTNKQKIAELKNGEFEKIYLATTECVAPYDKTKLIQLVKQKFNVNQRTPERVSKRRADKIRKKHFTVLKTIPLTENRFQLEIKAQSGLYIKELISGDNKRTNLSISSLLENECTCKQLDVLEILD